MGEFNLDTLFSTFVNFTRYLQYNNNMIVKLKFLKMVDHRFHFVCILTTVTKKWGENPYWIDLESALKAKTT
jgi:hypothetical protein